MSAKAIERFLALVDGNTIKKGECWIWKGANKGNGYGHFSMGGRSMPAHRASYALFVSEPKQGMDICHTCDNRACVNPSHLFLGSRLENMRDCMAKGRIARGEALGNRKGSAGPAAKLTDDEVRFIRSSGIKSKILAAQFNVTNDNINRIKRRDTWKEVL